MASEAPHNSKIMDSIRIIIIEDQTLMRQGLRTIIETEPGFEVIGDAEDGESGIQQVLALHPDVILMDVQLPGISGIEATSKICAAWPEAKVIILTTFSRDDYVYQGVRAGALGFLLKDVPADELLNTIQRVYRGELFIQPDVASHALRALVQRDASPLEPLSEREREVLAQLAQGLSNREIAQTLTITEGTVKNHVSSILGKLHVENRTQAANIARQLGLTD